jgi:hypothetical protein
LGRNGKWRIGEENVGEFRAARQGWENVERRKMKQAVEE